MQITVCLLFACGLIRYRLAFFQHDAVLGSTVISEMNSVLSTGRPTSSPIASSQILAEDMSEFRFMVGSLGRTSTVIYRLREMDGEQVRNLSPGYSISHEATRAARSSPAGPDLCQDSNSRP